MENIIDVDSLIDFRGLLITIMAYILGVIAIYSINVLADKIILKKKKILDYYDTIKIIDLVVLPIQFFGVSFGFFSLILYTNILAIYLPLILITSFICAIVKNHFMKDVISINMFKWLFLSSFVSTFIWMPICTFLIIFSAYR